MWCKLCQQDVPGIVSAGTGRYRCTRCGESFSAAPAADGRDILRVDCEEVASADGIGFHSQDHASGTGPPIAGSLYDGSAVEENLRELSEVLTDDEVEDPPSIPIRQWFRLDSSHAGPASWRTTPRENGSGLDNRGDTVISKVPWAVLLLGVATFAFGGALVTWSIVAGRSELWSTGVPLLLVGQIGLLVGLILQLDRLWHANRHTVAKVERLDHQLRESKSTRLDPAEEGSADQILADLKGRLDLLSEKISRDDGRTG